MKLVLEGQTLADILAEARRVIAALEASAVPIPTNTLTGKPVQAPVLEALPTDEPPWPAETIPQAAARVFPEAETKIVQQAERQDKPFCANHQKEMVYRPAGVSKRTGKPYDPFYSCPERECKVTARAA